MCNLMCYLPQVVYVLQANDDGQIVTPLPGAAGALQLQRSIDWLLVDGMTVSSSDDATTGCAASFAIGHVSCFADGVDAMA
jgi:hypothetical protein